MTRSIEAMYSLTPEELREIMGNVEVSTTLPILAKAQEILQRDQALQQRARAVLRDIEESRDGH